MIENGVDSRYKRLWIIVCLVGLILGYYGLILGQQAEKLNLRQQYDDLYVKVKAIEKFVERYPEQDQYIVELKAKQKQVDQLLPDYADISKFIIDTQNAASQTGVRIIRMKPGRIIPMQGYCEIPVEIDIQGEYFRSLAFYQQLQNLRLQTIKKMCITTRQGVLESHLSLVIFSYGEV